jgi:hypothetical protein
MSAVKEGQQKYSETVYSRSGINHMCISKNSKDFWITLNQDLSLRYLLEGVPFYVLKM